MGKPAATVMVSACLIDETGQTVVLSGQNRSKLRKLEVAFDLTTRLHLRQGPQTAGDASMPGNKL